MSTNGDISQRTEEHRAEKIIAPFLRQHSTELGITDDNQVPVLAHEVAHRERLAEQIFPPKIILAEVKEILQQANNTAKRVV